jgi:lipopolysaccharide/colanic/teichoic acid biosynthesis glycosyltransferase
MMNSRAAWAGVKRGEKRLADLVLCAAALPIALPLGAAIAFAIKLTSPGPIVYRAHRVGQDMKPIVVLKFRTMVNDGRGPGVTRSGDPRITPIGRFLRSSKLDELPQILNVIRGDMSIVGPRPEDPRYVAAYTGEQKRVLSVRPGMTSQAFLQFGHEQDLLEREAAADVESFYLTRILPQKLQIELEYVQEWSVLSDVRILARTVICLLRRPNLHIRSAPRSRGVSV